MTEESSAQSASLSWRCGNRVPPEPLWPDPSSHSPSHPDRRSDRPPETCAAPGTDTSEQTAEINQNDSPLKHKWSTYVQEDENKKSHSKWMCQSQVTE